ncbi:Pentatricopeptide repeat-containing protein, chloroplastic, partial [Cucurbita argyrosperma subsp. sororia]
MKTEEIEVPPSVWGALLGACRIHKNYDIGVIAGEKVLEKEPHNSGVYLILAEMYLGSGKREDAERILARMKNNGVKKQPAVESGDGVANNIVMNKNAGLDQFHSYISGKFRELLLELHSFQVFEFKTSVSYATNEEPLALLSI